MERVVNLDLYKLLDIEFDATDKLIRTAYRKKALACHPDKNPNNSKAAQLFHELSDALEVLTDKTTRQAYDTVLKARKAAVIRHQQLDHKRRKLKDDLERREREAEVGGERRVYADDSTDRDRLMSEIERLRRDGSRQLEEELEAMRNQIKNPTLSSDHGMKCNTLKVRWKDPSVEKEATAYDEETLCRIFSKYGTVLNVVTHNRSGLIEMETSEAAEMASNIECGFLSFPLKVKLLGVVRSKESNMDPGSCNPDMETLVLRKLRQAEERKRLIRDMLIQDAKDDLLNS